MTDAPSNLTHQNLTEGSILSHIVALSIPASMGMMFNTLYNLTDLWFAGLLSDTALTGLSIAGSVFFLLIAMGVGLQTGTAAMVASDVGAGRTETAGEWIDHAVGIAVVVAVVSLVVGWWVGDDLILFLGAEPDSAPAAREYLNVTLLGNIAFLLSFVAAGALMAMGDTTSNRNALAVGFFANFGLNPLLTFQMGLGVTGLALATVLIKAAGALYLFWVLRKRLGRWARPRFSAAPWLELLRQVLPASFSMMTIILGSFITISFIGRFGDAHVAGYSVGLRLEQVLLLPALGLNAAVMAVAGQNFGARLYDRVAEAYWTGLKIGLGMAVLFIPVMVFLSPALVGVFSDDAEIKATGAVYLRIDAIAFYAYVVLFLSVAALQAMKQPMFPMIMGVARQLVVPAAINYLLIVQLGSPMLAVFVTVVSVVVVAAALSHWWVLLQLGRLEQGGSHER